jgi:acetylornithine deacetylase/succinyl-diaminopimelate desuccinylase-like protein
MGTALNWDALREDAVATMSRYVQFDTTNPPGNEMPAAEWLADQLRNRGITRDVIIHEPVPRSTGLNLIRNRKGHTPHIAAMTAEPLPTRLASLALGTGDLDCVLSFRPA